MCDKNNHLRFEEDEYLYHEDTVLLGFLDPENKSSRYEDLIRSKHIAPQNLSSITGGHLFFSIKWQCCKCNMVVIYATLSYHYSIGSFHPDNATVNTIPCDDYASVWLRS